MKKFKFRYENILKMRLDEEEAVKARLKKINQELAEAENSLSMTKVDQMAFQESLNERMHTGVKGADLQMIGQHQNYFRKKIEQQKDQIAFLEKKLDLIKLELVEAMKERKIMEKLKEKDQKIYYEQANAAENKIVDEIVNYQNSKRSGE